MQPRSPFDSLPIQITVTIIVLVLLTAVAIGLPAIVLLRDQLDRQAWAQVAQGARAGAALYEAEANEVRSLTVMTSQRPTLRALVEQDTEGALPAYLRTLQEGAELDAILVCDAATLEPVILAGEPLPAEACATPLDSTAYLVDRETPEAGVWLVAARPIGDDDPGVGIVAAGRILDRAFLTQLRARSGMEHSLLVSGVPVASSLESARSLRVQRALGLLEDDIARGVVMLDEPYYYARVPLNPGILEDEMALNVADIFVTQRRLAWTLGGSIVLVVLTGSASAVLLARRIGRPLTRLSRAATILSRGDLNTTVVVDAGVREVTLVADALDQARRDLHRTLQELRREKAWVEHLLQAIVEGIVTLDPHNRITFFSQGAEEITGWTQDEVLGRHCDEVFQVVESSDAFTMLLPPPGRKHKITVEMAHGRQATLAVTRARLAPPQVDVGFALVFRDVSEEEAMHNLLGHFLANIAHEFRTPLSALAASIELLLDQAPELSPVEIEELLGSLHLGTLSLQTLVDNLLESASIEAGRFRVFLRPNDMGAIMAEAAAVVRPLLEKREQWLVVEEPGALPPVRADTRRMTQVLINLLSNANKYSPDRTTITVSATAFDGHVRVMVTDEGSGIPPEYHQELFRRFTRADSSGNGAQYGIGLGLSVVKAIVEAHGGEVGVETREGGGSLFWITVPRIEES
jgi:PAS domain S-box-containing protein